MQKESKAKWRDEEQGVEANKSYRGVNRGVNLEERGEERRGEEWRRKGEGLTRLK
jgi:hypothetical protein